MADFTVWLPRVRRDESGRISGNLVEPFRSDLWPTIPGAEPWGEIWFGETNHGPGDPQAAGVSQVAFKVRPKPGAGEQVVLSHNVGTQINEWFSRAVVWMELWSGNNLNVEDGVEPTTMWSVQFKEPGSPNTYTWFPSERIYDFSTDRALTKLILESAFRKATEAVQPADAWMLYLSASKSEDPRLSVIELGTAVEVALSRSIHDRLNGLSEAARNQIIVNAGGVVGLVRILEKLDESPQKSFAKRTMDQLAYPRNLAVHAAGQPALETVRNAFHTGRELLSRYAPLAGP
ncbi:hypothetical protein PJL15_03987 [Paenarthrobacter nitroguajacolicus]|nr:hypothetical protein [Paenarthrobacter nitroguajacolicus]